MTSQDHGIHSFKEFVQEGRRSLSTDSEKNEHKKNLDLSEENRIWEQVKVKLSLFTLGRNIRRRRTIITTKRRIRNKRSLEDILPMFDAILLMKRDTLQETFQRTRTPSTRRRDIMLITSKTMNQQTKYLEERRMVHMKSMC